jgi:hypothetical protein
MSAYLTEEKLNPRRLVIALLITDPDLENSLAGGQNKK